MSIGKDLGFSMPRGKDATDTQENKLFVGKGT